MEFKTNACYPQRSVERPAIVDCYWNFDEKSHVLSHDQNQNAKVGGFDREIFVSKRHVSITELVKKTVEAVVASFLLHDLSCL